ncbi:MAG: DUF1822 family protein [Microcoleus sp.]
MAVEKSFKDKFTELYKAKGFQSCYELSLESKALHGEKCFLTESYFSHLGKKRILNPRQDTLEKLAQVFAKKTYVKRYKTSIIDEEKMKVVFNDELKQLKDFFSQARKEIQPDPPSSPKIAKEIIWKITLGTDINNWHEIALDIMGQLEDKGNGMISVKEFKQGSIILILESSSEVFERIQSLHEAGQLSELLNVPVLDLQVLPNEERVNLSQWFENIFTTGWQSVEELLTPQQLSPAVWSDRVKQAKLFNLRADLISHAVNLVINLTRASEDKVSVWLQVYPSGEDYLPLNLKLLVLAEGEVFKEVTARSADVLIQCQFDADPGDEFTVKLALGEVSVTGKFVL